jgi:polar amino acid transport system permease protein
MPKVVGFPVSPFVAGLTALSCYFATHVAEIMRAGIQAIPKGQMEAALSSGLHYEEAMRYVVLPQAIRHMIPALISRLVALIKSTSLVYIIGVIELFRVATLINNREFASFQIFTFVALVYFALCFGLSRLGSWCQKRLGAQELRNVEAALGW